jgi:hypothetical protein
MTLKRVFQHPVRIQISFGPMIRRPANDSSMADSCFPFFSLIIQIGVPVNELKRLVRSLWPHQIRVKVLGLSQARRHGQGYLQKIFAAQDFICYTEFVLSVSDEQNPEPFPKACTG